MTDIQLDEEVEIERPPAEVFAFVGDHEHLPAWKGGVTRVGRTAPGPIGVGTTYRVVGRVLGRPIEATYELTAYEQDEMFSGRMASHVISYNETYRFEGTESRTWVHHTVKARPLGRIRHLRPLVGPLLRRQVRADHRRLKAILERTQTSPPEHTEDGEPGATDEVDATQAGHGVQAAWADDGVQATQADDGVQATQADDGVQATQDGDMAGEELAEDGTPRA